MKLGGKQMKARVPFSQKQLHNFPVEAQKTKRFYYSKNKFDKFLKLFKNFKLKCTNLFEFSCSIITANVNMSTYR